MPPTRLPVSGPSPGIGSHRVDDALQVVESGVFDDDLALVTALLDLYPRLVEVGEAVGQAEQARGDGLATRGSAPLTRAVIGAEGDDLFHAADGQALGDDPGGQALLCERVAQAEKG